MFQKNLWETLNLSQLSLGALNISQLSLGALNVSEESLESAESFTRIPGRH
jgi:hypothetical protein